MAEGRKVRRSSAHAVADEVFLDGERALATPLAEALRASGECHRATQSFHSYPARLHPDAAKLIVGLLPGPRLLDPFCGGGTLLVEGVLAGKQVIGRDLNPVAVLVAKTRTRLLNPDELGQLALVIKHVGAEAAAAMASGRAPSTPGRVFRRREWYHPTALAELSALYEAVLHTPHQLKGVLRALHSSLVVKYSRRASDTSNKVVDVKRPRGAVIDGFVAKGSELVGQLRALASAAPAGTPPADIGTGDAREIAVDAVDAIVTSPPYPGTYDYALLQQLRLAWLGVDGEEVAQGEIGSRRQLSSSVDGAQRWLADTRRWLERAQAALLPGGRLAIVLGDGLAAGRVLRAGPATLDAARALQLRPLASASTLRRDPATGKQKREQILLLEKPGS